MSKRSNLSYDDGMMIWKTRDAYRVQTVLLALFYLPQFLFALFAISDLSQGLWSPGGGLWLHARLGCCGAGPLGSCVRASRRLCGGAGRRLRGTDAACMGLLLVLLLPRAEWLSGDGVARECADQRRRLPSRSHAERAVSDRTRSAAMSQRWTRIALTAVLSVGVALPAQAQVLGTGVLQVQEIGAQLFHATVTAVQSTICAVRMSSRPPPRCRNSCRWMPSLSPKALPKTWRRWPILSRQAEGLSYDIASLQAQIDALFNLDTAPMPRRRDSRSGWTRFGACASRLHLCDAAANADDDGAQDGRSSRPRWSTRLPIFSGPNKACKRSSSSTRRSVRPPPSTRPRRRRISGPGVSTRWTELLTIEDPCTDQRGHAWPTGRRGKGA